MTRHTLARLGAAALVVAMSAASLGPAFAEDRDHHRDRRVHHVRRPPSPPPRAWGYDRPDYVQAPPPLVYAAPAPPAAINLNLGFLIR